MPTRISFTQRDTVSHSLFTAAVSYIYTLCCMYILFSVALLTVLAAKVKKCWWADPVGAIIISIYIIATWIGMIREQSNKLIGRTGIAHVKDV
jgi:divalent metal cation (Fe/Co/Zn/Cd) transporter